MDQRADACLGQTRVANDQRRGVGSDLLEQLVGNRGVDNDPSPGQTHLAGVHVLGDDRLRGGVEVGVGEHDERRLATEFEADRCECLGSGPPN